MTVHQNGHFAQTVPFVLSLQSVCLGAMYTKNSLIEARQDGLEDMVKKVMYHTAATSALLPTLILLYTYVMKYGRQVVCNR